MEKYHKEIAALRDRVAYLEQEVVRLNEIIQPLGNPFLGLWKLTTWEAHILEAVYKQPVASYDYLDKVTEIDRRWRRGSEESFVEGRVKVAVCKIRKKLPPGATIELVKGYGYMMPPKAKDIIREAMQ